MKVVENTIKTYARGRKRTKSYKVAQTSKVMDMFSNMLYSNKIRAVIRELSTNAWDAHVMAGNTNIAPTIILPCKSDPTFKIRDYGTGLSPEDLETMYLTYGESNKTHSNEFNGCMGIGSKSPFAYVDSFTTTSYYNGVKYVYINAKDDRGIPNLQLFHSEPTDEPNGLEISFACNADDESDFIVQAKFVLQWFPVPFNVLHDGKEVQIDNEHTYTLEGDGWKLRNNHGQSTIIMGYVEYPIDPYHFTSKKTNDSDWYRYYKDSSPVYNALQNGLEIHCDIGDVDMDISRESLQYNDHTINFIKRKVQDILKEMESIVSQKFDDCETFWDACVLLSGLNKSGISSLLDLVTPKYNNRGVGTVIYIKNVCVSRFGYSTYSKKTKRTENGPNLYVAAGKNVVFFKADMKRGNYAAIERWFELDGNSDKVVYLIKAGPEETIEDAVDSFCKQLGLDKSAVKSCQELPKAPKGSPKKKSVNVYQFDTSVGPNVRQYGTSWQKSYWNETTINFNKGGYYVEINNWKVRKKGSITFSSAKDLALLIEYMEQLGIDVPTVYGIKTTAIKKYSKSDKWIYFYEYANQQILDYIKSSNVTTMVKMANTLVRYKNLYDFMSHVSNATTVQFKNSSLFKILLDKFKNASIITGGKASEIDSLRSAMSLLSLNSSDLGEGNDDDLEKMAEEVLDKYDVLKVVPLYYGIDERKANSIVNLINIQS